MRTCPKFSPLIIQKKSSGGSWKDSGFFADGDWEFGESSDINSEYRVQTHFFTPSNCLGTILIYHSTISITLFLFFFCSNVEHTSHSTIVSKSERGFLLSVFNIPSEYRSWVYLS